MADTLLHTLNFVVGMFTLMGSPFFTKYFFKRCLDAEGTWMPLFYFVVAMLCLAVYINLGIIVYEFVITRC